MTKDECLKALDIIWYNGNEKEFNLLEQLIEEHFSNPLLRFEDLKNDMWVWDNVTKKYMKIFDISYSEKTFNVNGEQYSDPLHLEEFTFEENRFFRKQVD